jgi:hypothetical protein
MGINETANIKLKFYLCIGGYMINIKNTESAFSNNSNVYAIHT